MNNLRQLFKEQGLKNKDVAKIIRQEVDGKFNSAVMSYIVNGLALPTAPAWRVISRLTAVASPTEVFAVTDIDLFGFYTALAAIGSAKPADKRNGEIYDKLTVRLPKGTRIRLNLIIGTDKLYANQAEFILAALAEAEAKIARPAATGTDDLGE